jgi:hypothetical protein
MEIQPYLATLGGRLQSGYSIKKRLISSRRTKPVFDKRDFRFGSDQ